MLKDAFTIVIPVNNEEEILEKKIPRLIKRLKISDNYEILIVENGSEDRTLEITKNLTKRFKRISYVSLPYPDYGDALITGIINSKYDKVVWIGIDFNEEVLKFVDESVKFLNYYDIVLGSKRKGKDLRCWWRVFVSRTYNFLVKQLFNLSVCDVEGYKACRKNKVMMFIKKISSKGHLFDLEFMINVEKNNLKLVEVPIIVKETRKSGYITGARKLFRAILASFKTFLVLKMKYR